MLNILKKIPREIKRAKKRLYKSLAKKIPMFANNFVENKVYGKIYHPYYNLHVEMSSNLPEIYNKDGQKMDAFFVRDMHEAHCPYSNPSKYFLWDRFNIGLETHFYSHNAMLETMGKPTKKYGYLIEATSIVPNDYLIFEKHKGLEKDFDAIYTYDKKILDNVENAKFFPFCAQIWNKNHISLDFHTKKSKNISMLSSNKLMCDLHKYRYETAIKCKQNLLVDTYGTFDGGSLVPLATVYDDYRYSICIENSIEPYFFTERLTTAFYSQTIPIYLGATQIDKFFNPDGIIQIDTGSDIEEVIRQCTEKEYLARLPAIVDNYNRALKYRNINDLLYECYFSKSNLNNPFRNIS